MTITPGASGWRLTRRAASHTGAIAPINGSLAICSRIHGIASTRALTTSGISSMWRRVTTGAITMRASESRRARRASCMCHSRRRRACPRRFTHCMRATFSSSRHPRPLLETCQARSAECRDLGAGLNDLHSTLDRTLTEPETKGRASRPFEEADQSAAQADGRAPAGFGGCRPRYIRRVVAVATTRHQQQQRISRLDWSASLVVEMAPLLRASRAHATRRWRVSSRPPRALGMAPIIRRRCAKEATWCTACKRDQSSTRRRGQRSVGA